MPSERFQYANTVRGIVERIAFQLNDAETGWEYQTWSSEWITARVLDTFKWFQGDDPSLFSEEVEIELESGSKQRKPENCDRIISFECMVDDKGNRVPIQESDYKAKKSALAYDKLMPDCMLESCNFVYSINPLNRDEFLISPPVPVGKTYTAIANCSDANSYFEDVDKVIDCEFARYINAVIAWVMYEATSMDGLNPVLVASAERYRNSFFQLAPQLKRFDDDAN